MTRKHYLILGLTLGLAVLACRPAATASGPNSADLANRHLSAILLIQKWAQAIYHFIPLGGHADCAPVVGEWTVVGKRDGVTVYQREIAAEGCFRIIDTNYGGSPSDYDREVTYAGGRTERLVARTTARLLDAPDGAPARVHMVNTFSDGSRAEYDLELRQEAAVDEAGPIPSLAFLYGLITKGTIQLANGQALDFELRQTQAFECFNFFSGMDIPVEECEEWFVFNPDFGVMVPKPDRLTVSVRSRRSGRQPQDRMDLTLPLIEPNVLDFSQAATGTLVLGGTPFTVRMSSDNPEIPGWTLWETSGPGFQGSFVLGSGFSGRGQVFRSGGGARGRKRLHFAGRWNESAVGTVVLGDGQTRAASPTSGLLEFGSLKWAGLAAAFGPSPGL